MRARSRVSSPRRVALRTDVNRMKKRRNDPKARLPNPAHPDPPSPEGHPPPAPPPRPPPHRVAVDAERGPAVKLTQTPPSGPNWWLVSSRWQATPPSTSATEDGKVRHSGAGLEHATATAVERRPSATHRPVGQRFGCGNPGPRFSTSFPAGFSSDVSAANRVALYALSVSRRWKAAAASTG